MEDVVSLAHQVDKSVIKSLWINGGEIVVCARRAALLVRSPTISLTGGSKEKKK